MSFDNELHGITFSIYPKKSFKINTILPIFQYLAENILPNL